MTVSNGATHPSLSDIRPRSNWTAAPKQTFFLLSKLSLGIALSLPVSAFAETAEDVSPQVKFSTGFLQNGGQGVDLSEFLQGSSVVV